MYIHCLDFIYYPCQTLIYFFMCISSKVAMKSNIVYGWNWKCGVQYQSLHEIRDFCVCIMSDGVEKLTGRYSFYNVKCSMQNWKFLNQNLFELKHLTSRPRYHFHSHYCSSYCSILKKFSAFFSSSSSSSYCDVCVKRLSHSTHS